MGWKAQKDRNFSSIKKQVGVEDGDFTRKGKLGMK